MIVIEHLITLVHAILGPARMFFIDPWKVKINSTGELHHTSKFGAKIMVYVIVLR